MADPFPEDPMAYELDLEPEWQTIVNRFGGANEQRRGQMEFSVYNASIRFDREMVDKSQMQAIWDHYMSCRGAYDGFFFYDYLVAMHHYDQLCAVADGVLQTFDLPGRGTSQRTVYVGGIADGTATYEVGTGTAGADRAVLTVVPPQGTVITADFYGYLRAYGRYEKDKLARGTFFDFAFDFGIKIKGLPLPV